MPRVLTVRAWFGTRRRARVGDRLLQSARLVLPELRLRQRRRLSRMPGPRSVQSVGLVRSSTRGSAAVPAQSAVRLVRRRQLRLMDGDLARRTVAAADQLPADESLARRDAAADSPLTAIVVHWRLDPCFRAKFVCDAASPTTLVGCCIGGRLVDRLAARLAAPFDRRGNGRVRPQPAHAARGLSRRRQRHRQTARPALEVSATSKTSYCWPATGPMASSSAWSASR